MGEAVSEQIGMSARPKTRASKSSAQTSGGIAQAVSRAAAKAADVPVQGALSAVAMGIVLEREARAAVGSASTRFGLGLLDATLARVLADDVVDRVLDGVEAAKLPQRVSERLLDEGIAEQIATRVLEGPELERVVSVALSSKQVHRTLTRAVENEASERLVEQLTSSEGSERLVALLMNSRLPEEIVSRLLESEALWVFVDEIARSPSVTEAIQHQSVGFVDEIADRARDRSRNADAWVQRLARRVGRHRSDAGNNLPPTSALPGTEAP
jgi:hypothetical protein